MYEFNDFLNEKLENPEFKKAWEETEIEYRIARNIINERSKLNLSQSELAKRAATTQSVIARIESGNANITIKTLEKLSNALDTSVSYITRSEKEKIQYV